MTMTIPGRTLGQTPLATGSDYGGSLRTPAGFCGVSGFRPSPGVVPGETRAASLIPFSVLGPMGRSIEDAHLLLMAQAGIDKGDPFSSSDCLSLPEKLGNIDLSTVRAAFSADLGCAPIDRGIAGMAVAQMAQLVCQDESPGAVAQAQREVVDLGLVLPDARGHAERLQRGRIASVRKVRDGAILQHREILVERLEAVAVDVAPSPGDAEVLDDLQRQHR